MYSEWSPWSEASSTERVDDDKSPEGRVFLPKERQQIDPFLNEYNWYETKNVDL